MIRSRQCGMSAKKFSPDQTHDKEAQYYRADQDHSDNCSPSPKLVRHAGLCSFSAQFKDLPISSSRWMVAPVDFLYVNLKGTIAQIGGPLCAHLRTLRSLQELTRLT